MYNGIGILTPRGTGTSGYVQSNKFNVRRQPGRIPTAPEKNNGPAQKQPNQEILDHNRKREIEVKCMQLADELEEQGYSQEDIDAIVDDARQKMEEEAEKKRSESAVEKLTDETHEVAMRKLQQMDKLKNALNLSDVKEGDAFDTELQEQKKLQRIAEREELQRKKEEEQKKRKAAAKAEAKRKEKLEKQREKERELNLEQQREAEKFIRETAERRYKVEGRSQRRTELLKSDDHISRKRHRSSEDSRYVEEERRDRRLRSEPEFNGSTRHQRDNRHVYDDRGRWLDDGRGRWMERGEKDEGEEGNGLPSSRQPGEHNGHSRGLREPQRDIEVRETEQDVLTRAGSRSVDATRQNKRKEEAKQDKAEHGRRRSRPAQSPSDSGSSDSSASSSSDGASSGSSGSSGTSSSSSDSDSSG